MRQPQDATARRVSRAFPRPARARGVGGVLAAIALAAIAFACLAASPWAFGVAPGAAAPRYRDTDLGATKQPPWWAAESAAQPAPEAAPEQTERAAAGRPWLGTDALGRDVLARCLAGGVLSLSVGGAAALISVVVGVLYGMISGYAGGRADAVMMRIVDVLYGLPYILLVVLLSVAASALADARESREMKAVAAAREAHVAAALIDAPPTRAEDAASRRASAEAAAALAHPLPPESRAMATRVLTLVAAIGAVSWLTLARVVRAQTMSLRARPFVEAARASGASTPRILRRHILPNLAAPIVVYATLTVPQAILQESFLSFLGIGIAPPLPSWGNLVADGLRELNPVRSRWWLLLFPCLLLTTTLLALNAVGESMRERLDPRGRRA